MFTLVTTVKTRPYRMTIRRGDAPALVVAAATKLFAAKGYAATSMEDIAAEAGVARPTVFSAVGPKPVILRRVVDHAIAGDDAPLPVSERDWWRAAVDEPDSRRAIELLARSMVAIASRIALIARAMEMAASVDVDAASVWDRYQTQRRAGLREFAVALQRKAPVPRCGIDTVTDTLWALQPSAYLRLVHDAGWEPEQYEAWLTDLLTRMFVE
jgi:AcrR family transcriptional regulator